jgi:Rap1a immunity proteins
MRRVVCMLAVLVALVGQPEAIETGRELAQMCAGGEATDQMIGNLLCAGYIDGFVDAYQVSMAVMEHQAPKARKPICLPHRGVEIGQVQALVVDWLKRHPKDHDSTARTVGYEVLATAYPCEGTPVKRK